MKLSRVQRMTETTPAGGQERKIHGGAGFCHTLHRYLSGAANTGELRAGSQRSQDLSQQGRQSEDGERKASIHNEARAARVHMKTSRTLHLSKSLQKLEAKGKFY